ncbi:hypothetical protein H1R20_g14661, partial [Candolleomyces eurysporus]
MENFTYNYVEGNMGSASYSRAIFESMESWNLLQKNAAPNALNDSMARFDAPKCDEDTRVGVLGEIMGWIQDRTSPQRLLCLTGAAGAGKSAIQQTIAERCSGKKILASAFFFSTADATRNTVAPVIPTIAYQLSTINPLLRYCIVAAIDDDPLVFSKSLKAQINTLIARPLLQYKEKSKASVDDLPYVILIDGLDECADEGHQAGLLAAIKERFLDHDLPFRLFIASRPEWAMRTALDLNGCLHQKAYHIQLSNKYDASADIRRFLQRRLRDIGDRSGNPEAHPSLWPTKEDVEALLRAASGQFIYAATVIRFVSEGRSSPVNRLNTILKWTTGDTHRFNPFAALDLLYSRILSRAKDAYEAADPNRPNFLLLLNAYRINVDRNEDHILQDLDILLCSEPNSHAQLIYDLHSLITIEPYNNPRASASQNLLQMNMHHQSFLDFLIDKSRSKHLFVPPSRVLKFAALRCLENINGHSIDEIRWVDHVAASRDPSYVESRRLHHSLTILPGLLLDPELTLDDFPADQVIQFASCSGLEKVNKWLKIVTSAQISSPEPWINFVPHVLKTLQARTHSFLDSVPRLTYGGLSLISLRARSTD